PRLDRRRPAGRGAAPSAAGRPRRRLAPAPGADPAGALRPGPRPAADGHDPGRDRARLAADHRCRRRPGRGGRRHGRGDGRGHAAARRRRRAGAGARGRDRGRGAAVTGSGGATAPGRAGGRLDAVWTVTAAACRTAASLRGARAFHPRGLAFAAEVVLVRATAPPGFPRGRYRGIVRFSRGAGLPAAVPDILGIGVRVVDAGGPHVHQDLLMASTGWSVVGRRLLRPRRSFTSGVLSTILPYDVGGRRVLIGARVAGDRPLALADVDVLAAARRPVELLWSTPGGLWRVLGEVRPDVPLDDEAGRRLDLDP